jgi:murein DD-endopeptidase MepM/ murein hydrolase activator NlpD
VDSLDPAKVPAGNAVVTRRQLRESEAQRGKARPPAKRKSAVAKRVNPYNARPPKQRQPKQRGSKLMSLGAMLFAGALLVGLSVPANAFITDAAAQPDSTAAKTTSGQTVAVSSVVSAADTTRTNFTVTSYLELMRARYGNRDYSYTVGIGPVQWPFPYPVPIGDGWGERIAPCRACSTFHKGLDFLPGLGAPIHAIADGVVSMSAVTSSGLGNEVTIEHVINGVKITSLYGHMKMNSSPLHVGDIVKVGDLVGLVGQTGEAVGPHLHFEIHVDGVQVDPWPWLKLNAAS